MSLRYIPNNTKLNPLQMFLKFAKEQEDVAHRKMIKKRQSVEYFMLMRKALGYFFTDNLFLASYLEQFELENKKIKKNLEKVQADTLKKYFENNSFNKDRFEQDFQNILSSLSVRFNESEPLSLAVRIIEKNEIVTGELIKPDVCVNLDEYKTRFKERQEEMQYLFMYLAKASDKELSQIKTLKPNSELVQSVTDSDLYIKIRQSYQQQLQQAVIKDKKVIQKRKLA